MQAESNPRIKAIWERFLDYELGHLELVRKLFKDSERRDPAEVLGADGLVPLVYKSQRDFVRQVLAKEVDYRAIGTEFNDRGDESEATLAYRNQLNASGSPSQAVSAGYRWQPGTELNAQAVNF